MRMSHQLKQELNRFIWTLWKQQKKNDNNTKLIKGEKQ